MKKYGCVCTCCHIDNLPWYKCVIFLTKCVIFLTKNYNFDIPAVANTLSKRHREIRQKEFICKPCHKQLKDGKYSSNVQNCDHSDLFGSNVNHEQGSQNNLHDSRTHNENNVTYDLPSLYMTQTMILTNHCLCTCCHKTDIPRSQSSSKHRSTTWTMLLFKKHYLTDSQFLHPRNTFARNVTNIF